MKWILILLISVAFLVAAWLLFGPSSTLQQPPGSLRLPPPAAEKAEIIRAAGQLLEYRPAPAHVDLGLAFLSLLKDRIPAEEWSAVQKPAFIGWERIRHTPGAHEGVARLAPALYLRFARWGSVEELEQMIRTIPGHHWKAEVERGLDEAAGAPLEKYEGSRVQALVTASLRAGEVDRAGRYLEKATWTESALGEAKLAVEKRSELVALHAAGRSGRPDFAKLAALWSATSSEPELAMLAEQAGANAARSGRHALDYSLVVRGVEETRPLPGALDYWKAVLWRIAREAGKGVFGESETLTALAKAIGESAFEAEFWEKTQALTPEKDYPQAMWRVTCWKRVIAASGDAAKREAALRAIVREHLAFDARRARKELAELRSQVGAESADRVLAELGKELDAAEQVLAKRQEKQEENRKKLMEAKPGQVRASGIPVTGGIPPK